MKNILFAWNLFVIVIALSAVIGWGLNVYKLTQLDFEKPYRAEAIRGVGLFPLLGPIIGYIDIEDGEKSDEQQG